MPNMSLEHRNADLEADAGQKADQHRARQEIGEESQSEDPREQQSPAVSSATMLTSATYRALPGTAHCDIEPATIAAVAESAATTRWRDEPNSANATSGSSSV